MIHVLVNLYASLADHLPEDRQGNSCAIDVEPGTTVEQLLHRLRIPQDAPKITFLNGVHSTLKEALKEGDRVAVFPPIAGG
ncbi:MAG: MoaD/ThiS family protein [Thermodesulfobacteriota bacterium]